MSAASLTGLLATFSGVVMALSPLLQARRVMEIRDSSEVSQAFVCVLIGNACVWIVHGVVTANLVLLIPNAVTLLAAAGTLAVVRHFRHGHAPVEADAAAVAAAEPAHDEHQPARAHASARRAAAFERR